MKTLKHLALAALMVTGLLFPATIARPQPASASCDDVIAVISIGVIPTNGCGTPFTPSADSCSLTIIDVSASADGNRNSYKYDLGCSFEPPIIHVNGLYDFSIGIAHESLVSTTYNISADWTCPHDPWIAPSPAACPHGTATSNSVGGAPGVRKLNLGSQIQPFSTQLLTDDERQALFFAQLRYAAAHPPAPAPVIIIARSESTTTTNQCAVCHVLETTPDPAAPPTLPDFKIMAVRAVQPKTDPITNKELLPIGQTAGYDVVVANLGAKSPQTGSDPSKKPQVQVSIQVTGSLQYVSMVQTPTGWDCTGTGSILCVGPLGGYGDAIQDTVVTFRLQVLGVKGGVGVGAISASADPNGLVKESDVTNNAFTLAITVN
jgi:hypothetical protein